ncbi:MAG: DUF484 family protein [Magnetococcales bacterium]|nr:DUF484 family protein [Magnetococcales bacterium]
MDSDLNIQEEQIYSWLKENPDFFKKYPELLPAAITASGKVLNLEAGQLKSLQKQNEQLKERLESILARLNRNDEIHQAYHAIQIKLLTAQTPQELITVATESPEEVFDIGRITVAICEAEKNITGLCVDMGDDFPKDRLFFIEEKELLSTLNNKEAPIIRVGLEGNNRHLFFGSYTKHIRSEALVPLFSHPDKGKSQLIGSLNIGDPSPSRFLPSDSTELLQDLANVLGLCLSRLANCQTINA